MGYYLGIPISSTLVTSPLREDHKPTCSFYYGRTGRLYFHDFGVEKSYDVFDIVKELFKLSFRPALLKIMEDKDKFTEVNCEVRKKEGTFKLILGEDNSKYFDRYFVKEETLKFFNVFPLKSFYLNNTLIGKANINNPIYAYKFQSGRFKIYRPLSKERREKWSGNSNAEDISGFPQLPYRGKLLIITSSLKDVMVLKTLGYSAISFNGEGYGTSDSESSRYLARIILSLRRRFEYILFFMDNDKPGIDYSVKLSHKHGLPHALLPVGPKDISDYIQKNKSLKTHRTLKKLISKTIRNERSNSEIPFISTPY